MEDRAPYHTLAPKAPRNLAAPLAEWLRTQGFTVTERHYDTMTTVAATWTGVRGDCFELAYLWSAGRCAAATTQLQVRWPGQPVENLFGAQRVRRLREVRLLLTGNVRYANARLLATLPHPVL
jgi:hypothetical protein